MRRDETAISLLALGLGLLGAVLLTFLPLSLGYLTRVFREGAASPLGLLALGPTLVAAVVCGWLLRSLVRANQPLPKAPAPRARSDGSEEARTRLLELAAHGHSFTLDEALAASGLEFLDLELLLDDLLQRGALRAEAREGAIVYRRST